MNTKELRMKLSTSKKVGLVLCFSSSLLLHGQEEQKPMYQEKEVTRSSYPMPCPHLDEAYGYFASASFTYWQPMQDNMKLGVSSNNSGSLDLVNGEIIDLDNNFKPGFKVGIGMNVYENNWETLIEYTWFRGTEKASVNLDPNNSTLALYPSWQIGSFLNPQYSSGSESWKLNMDVVDWDIRRNISSGKQVCLQPFMGARLAFITQKVDVDYVNTNPSDLLIWPSTSINQSTKSWGLGPRVGFTSNWNLGKGFKIFGGGEGDILFTRYDLSSCQSSDIDEASVYKIKKNNQDTLRAHFMLDLGLGWGMQGEKNDWHLDFSADYAFQVFYNQNMFQYLVSNTSPGIFSMASSNLYMQGLTVSAQFSF